MPFHIGADARGKRIVTFGRELPSAPPPERPSPDWTQARPPEIRGALERARALPGGGWYVVDASRRITEKPSSYWIDGREYVAWRAGGRVRVAPNHCPHMAAPLSAGRVQGDKLVCPWHGLQLAGERHGRWEPEETHDDGVLTWVRTAPGEDPTPAPILPRRPDAYIDGVIRMVARCEPSDVLANRLDPWHGAWFHPHSFARLRVLRADGDVLTVRVAFRVLGPMCVEVDCTFHCPEPRTIVMTIVDGEGVGSVVETHATPVAPGWTAIVEATLATSDRAQFRFVRAASSLLRPFVERSARRLWVEDAAYAERAYHLRTGEGAVPQIPTDWSRPPGTPVPR